MSNTKHNELDWSPVSRLFQKRLSFYNSLDELGFKEWLFHPAMLFGSCGKWWGDLSKRNRPHEGLDLCVYRTEKGDTRYLEANTKVPVIFEGQVVRIGDDFLGQSVFVSHGAHGNDGSRLHTIYAHIKPDGRIHRGERLSEGDIIGTIADARRSGGVVPPHLHVSVAWISNTVCSQELDWQIVADLGGVVLLDPLRVIDCPYSIVARI